ncbi:Gamma-glutamyl phosphate reductase [Anaerohalosphaera lusitana]|uniref:Gamma-glutamyl phosphate reductase n=1 Tax=Anaerohalosphaera lusitana TaxID=1936003 RepID=A0A1U9NKC0_9BACT|nr:glutamate-5-semialdehyde dehydrogenase [Anaerohalosphaera lusitana]AQT68265.1 Gamma-glutamyl phosphate reductase [Anaerohalosphaera lusitana]
MSMQDMAKQARLAGIRLAAADSETKNKALQAVIDGLRANTARIIEANTHDMEGAEADGLAKPLLKRLKFDEPKIETVIAGIESLIGLDEPVGKVQSVTELDGGLELSRVACPIGVIGVIFESRPDALVQIGTLCLKSGNACLLKGGSEAAETNRVLADVLIEAGDKAGLPSGWLGLMETRQEVSQMLGLDEYIDLIIPRGSNEFVRHIMDNSRIPVMGHADGICHVYVDEGADIHMAVRIVEDSKCQYPAVCNAAETVLVHSKIADVFLSKMKDTLEARGVDLRGDDRTVELIGCKPASEQDWRTEYLDLVLAVKVVDSLDEAVEHINEYGSGHTDAIVTKEQQSAEKFMQRVDSADVLVNCSTRFADGYRFGLGAEVGISTSKLHARGPVGLDGLMTYKYRLIGNGHIVADYAEGRKKFTHRKLQ